jgi:outer membrane protein assembly factor BamB
MIRFGLIIIITGIFLIKLQAQKSYSDQWPGFRGPRGSGTVEHSKPPVSWDVDSLKNIKWKTSIPGLGHSCPVIWDDFLFVTTAVSEKTDESLKVGLYGDIDMASDSSVMEFKVYCLDKNNGRILWERTAHKGIPKSQRHTKSSQANCTPVTDGRHLVVHFGSEGLFCYDFKGNLLWKKDMGILNPGPYTDPGVEWGYASSPVIYNNRIIIQADIPKNPSTWCTPAICTENGKTQVVANGFRRICGYDIETGKVIWRLSNGGDAPAPAPVVAHHIIYLNSAHGKFSPIFAVKPDAVGDITLPTDSTKNKYIVWSIKRGGAYMQTPLIYGDYLYNLQVNGALTCFNALTGEVKYKENLSDAFSASGIAADGKVYFSSENGKIFVVQAGPVFKLLSVNKMNDVCMATPALSGNAIFFRTQHYLVAVE